MEFYILKSGICLVIFYGFYKLVLEKESFHVFKRFYLLASVVSAFGIPLITFTEYIEVIPQEVPLFFPESSITHTVIEAEPINYMPIILWSIYGLGVLLFSFKFLKNLSGIICRIKRNPKFKNQNFINVLLQDLVIPHTFFSYIFLNKHKFETHQIPKEVLLHEETHAKQKHSLDVLFIEILQILFWFNPIIYFFKHSIKLNHEFLADQAVLRKGTEPLKYQSLLLAFSSNATEPLLANAINYSSIKKRFTVMNTHTSKQAFWLRSLILLPLLALLIYSFSEKEVVEKEASEPFVIQQNITTNGVTEAMMKEYRDFILNTERTNMIVYPKYLRAVAIYDLMTEEQRNSVKKYPETPIINLSKVESKIPSSKEFDSWKNSSEFAIWIDGKHVDNTELNNYNVSDIKYFTTSFVYNNARSKKFPQPYQNHLYTQKGFEETYLKSNAKKYNSLKTEYLKAIEENTISSDELKILKAQLDRAFDNLTEEEIEKYNIIKVPTILIKTNDSQQNASSEEIEEYNSLVKKFNSLKEGERIIKVKDKNRIEHIYSLMTHEQKKENKAFPDFSTIAPPPKPYQKNTPQDLVEEYKKKYNELETLKNTPPHYIHKTEKEQEKMYALFLDLSTMYFKMFSSNRQLVSRPEAPILPYTKLIRDGKIEYKKISDLTEEDKKLLPPPPPPPAPIMPKNPSKELLEAKKKFEEKAGAYGKAMEASLKEREGNFANLKTHYEETMKLYNAYRKLAEKEDEWMTPPPPPPPAKK